MRLIDADELLKHKYHDSNRYENAVACHYIYNAPTIELPQWTPCSERLPKINHNVLLSTTNGEVFVGYRDKPDLIWQVTENGDEHWVYDPEAYTDDIDSLPKGEDCGFSRYTGNDYRTDGMLSVTSPNYDKRWGSVNAWMPLPKPYGERKESEK